MQVFSKKNIKGGGVSAQQAKHGITPITYIFISIVLSVFSPSKKVKFYIIVFLKI